MKGQLHENGSLLRGYANNRRAIIYLNCENRTVVLFLFAPSLGMIPFPIRAVALGLTTGTRHAIVRNNFTTSSIGGGYAEWVTQPISAAWSSTNNTRFIVESLWINTDNYSSSWIEVGFLDGAHRNSTGYTYAHGFYTARGIVSGGVIQSYTEYLISGPSTSNGTNHAYEVQYDGNNSWGAYVDFQLGRAWSGAPGADTIDVGMETNTSASSADRITTTRLQGPKRYWHDRLAQLDERCGL